MALLVQLAKEQGSLVDLSIGALPNSLNDKFEMNRKKVFNTLVFQEMLRTIAASLEAKITVSNLIQQSQRCHVSDIHLNVCNI